MISLRNWHPALGAVTLMLSLGAISMAAEKSSTTKPATQPYPLTVCVVSGESLSDMGDAVIYNYQGREVRFCCKDCVADFKKDPKKYLAKLDAAQKSATTKPAPATKPADDHAKMEH